MGKDQKKISSLEQPKEFITNADKKMIFIAFLLALICTFSFSDPFSYFTKTINSGILQAIPLKVGIFFFILPLTVYFTIITMEKCHFEALLKQAQYRIELIKKRQKIHFTSRYKEFDGLTFWEVTNRSIFEWTNAKFFIECIYENEKKTEKFELGKIPILKRVTIHSKLEPLAGAKWRVMVLSEEGFTIDIPERQDSFTCLKE